MGGAGLSSVQGINYRFPNNFFLLLLTFSKPLGIILDSKKGKERKNEKKDVLKTNNLTKKISWCQCSVRCIDYFRSR